MVFLFPDDKGVPYHFCVRVPLGLLQVLVSVDILHSVHNQVLVQLEQGTLDIFPMVVDSEDRSLSLYTQKDDSCKS